MAYIFIEDLSIKFEKKTILSHFNLTIEKGEKIVFMGESGKGKTTLLNAILGFEHKWESGKIYFKDTQIDAKNLSFFRSQLSWIPQEVNFFKGTVKDFIYLPFFYKNNKSNFPAEQTVFDYFELFNLGKELFYKGMETISGGEKQRVALISILLLKKQIILLDEPTSALDYKTKTIVTDFILNNTDLTVISASHDMDWVNRCTKIVEI